MKNSYHVPKKLLKTFRNYFPYLAVMAVIDFRGKILVVKRKEDPAAGRWWLPGGRVYKKEPAEKAAIRVAKKETGLDCRIVRFLTNLREIYKDPGLKDGISDSLTLVYLMKPRSKNQAIALDKTSADYKLISKIEKDLHPNIKKISKISGIFHKNIIPA